VREGVEVMTVADGWGALTAVNVADGSGSLVVVDIDGVIGVHAIRNTKKINESLVGNVFFMMNSFITKVPNELRSDAAERDNAKKEGASAAASLQVERSRTLEDTTLLGIKAQGQARSTQPPHKLHQSMEELYMEKERFCRGKKS
jgi:hypothetical protein